MPLATLATVAREWGRIGILGFGGPPAHVALLRDLTVDRSGWIDAREFEDAFAACSLLPGPASTQLSIYTAQRVAGRRGALVGGLAFILPGLVAVLVIAAVALGGRPPDAVDGFGAGAAAAVVAVVVQAGLKLIDLRNARVALYVAAGALGAAFAGAAVVGVLLLCGLLELAYRARHRLNVAFWPALIWMSLKVGALSYGGGYVIIPLMYGDAVEAQRWMTEQEFANAVAYGQITPGPVTHTVALVGYAAGGLGAALAATAVAFAPSFAMVMLGAPHFDRLRHSAHARAFLDAGAARAPRADLGARRRRTRGARHYALAMQDETVEVLTKLIQFHTVNPPGNERECLEWLAAYLSDAGLEVELDGAEPERPNLVATYRGGEDGPTLGYLSHVDTVLADKQDWSADPWGAELRNGFLYGRGTIDMKNQTAAEAVAAAHLARSGARFKGTLKVISVADEETGGILGAKWITEQRPDLARVDYLLNEGAGALMPYGDRRLYGVCVAEKGTFRFNVSTTGTAAHASVPGLASNALLKLAPLITKLGQNRPRYDLMEATSALVEALGEDPQDPMAALERVAAVEPRLAPLLDAAMRVTFAPTIVSAGTKINVIPARAQVRVDCRVPPGMGEDVALKRAREVLGGEDGLQIDFTEAVVGNRSPVESKLMDAIGSWLGEHDPGAEAVPTVLPAFTDSRWFRAAFPDCVAYGFFPQRHQTIYETWPLMHAADERIDVRDLGFAAAFFHDLPGRLLT